MSVLAAGSRFVEAPARLRPAGVVAHHCVVTRRDVAVRRTGGYLSPVGPGVGFLGGARPLRSSGLDGSPVWALLRSAGVRVRACSDELSEAAIWRE